MTAMAASNAVSPLTAPPAPAVARNDAMAQRGAGTDHFAQALQRRLERSESRPVPPQRPVAAGERAREQAPRTDGAQRAETEGTAARGAAPGADGEKPNPEPTAERTTGTESDTAASEAAPPIAGLPASIAAILQNIAGQRGELASGGIGGSGAADEGSGGAAPIAFLARGADDTAADPLQNRGGRWLPAPPADDAQAMPAATEAGETGIDGKDFAAQLRHTLAAEGSTARGMEAGTVGGVPQPAPMPAAARPLQMQVATPAGHAEWAEDVGSRVTLLVGRGESKAELVLTPPHLGRLEVSLTVDGDKTTAQFVAATPAARDALEQALPRLREVLQQAGIALGQANVSTSGEQQAQRHGGKGEGNGRGGTHGVAGVANDAGNAPAATWLRRSDGMVDIFA